MTAQVLFRSRKLMQVCVPKDMGRNDVIAFACAGEDNGPDWQISPKPFNGLPCLLHEGNVHISLED